MAKDYMQQAQDQYNPQFNAQLGAIQNALNNNLASLNGQVSGINNNYDKAVQNQNLNSTLATNNISNAMLGRGLANSSIAVSGIAEQQAKNQRMVGNINDQRTADLNNVENQKNVLNQNFNNTKGQMEADKLGAIRSLAYQLEDRDYEKTFKDKQLAMQQLAQEQQQGYNDKMLQLKAQEQAQAFQMQQLQQQLAREQMQSELSWQQQQLAMQDKWTQDKLNFDKEQWDFNKYLKELQLKADGYFKTDGISDPKDGKQIGADSKVQGMLSDSAKEKLLGGVLTSVAPSFALPYGMYSVAKSLKDTDYTSNANTTRPLNPMY